MLINKVPRLLYGWLEAIVYTNKQNEFLSICLENNISLFSCTFTEDGIRICASVSDYKKLQKVVPYKRKILKKHGLRFWTFRYRKRLGIPIGAIILLFLLIFSSGFVWNIDIKGNQRLSDNVIIDALKENGMFIGAYKKDFNIRDIKRKITNEFYDIAWITINLDGSFAHVEIKERDYIPASEDKSSPSNLVAACDGQIMKMEIIKGKPMITVGSAVRAGDLLVAGFYNDKKDNIIIEHSSGRVYARVDVSKKFEISKKIEKLRDVKYSSRYSVVLGNFEIKSPFSKAIDTEAEITNKQLNIFGLKLPIFLKQYKSKLYSNENVTLSLQDAKERIYMEIDNFEKSEFYDGEILSKNIVWKETDDKLWAIVDYEVSKNIAKQQYIDTE